MEQLARKILAVSSNQVKKDNGCVHMNLAKNTKHTLSPSQSNQYIIFFDKTNQINTL